MSSVIVPDAFGAKTIWSKQDASSIKAVCYFLSTSSVGYNCRCDNF
jgi:hypothetical protein